MFYTPVEGYQNKMAWISFLILFPTTVETQIFACCSELYNLMGTWLKRKKGNLLLKILHPVTGILHIHVPSAFNLLSIGWGIPPAQVACQPFMNGTDLLLSWPFITNFLKQTSRAHWMRTAILKGISALILLSYSWVVKGMCASCSGSDEMKSGGVHTGIHVYIYKSFVILTPLVRLKWIYF